MPGRRVISRPSAFDEFAAKPQCPERQGGGDERVVFLRGREAVRPGAVVALAADQIVDIERFETPEHLVGYFGIFPEENSSGVDKHGIPLPPGTLHMCPKAMILCVLISSMPLGPRSATTPPSAPLSPAQGKGKRVTSRSVTACASFSTSSSPCGKPIAPSTERTSLGENPGAAPLSTTTPGELPPLQHPLATIKPWATNGTARKGSGHHGQVHRRATASLSSRRHLPPPATRPKVEYAFLRQQVTLEQVLEQLGLMKELRRPRRSAAWSLPRPQPTRRREANLPPSIWGRASFSASTPIAGSRGTCWISGQPSSVCRFTTPP